MTITVRKFTEDGLVEYQLPGPGTVKRFTVGTPGGARSALWRLWEVKKTSDVYLWVRSLGRFQKVSLHQSGDWRLQWTTPKVAEERGSGGPNRILAKWPRPAAMDGWSTALTVCVPGEDVVPFTGKPAPADVIWIPRPEATRSWRSESCWSSQTVSELTSARVSSSGALNCRMVRHVSWWGSWWILRLNWSSGSRSNGAV